jgi:hypothetical protein
MHSTSLRRRPQITPDPFDVGLALAVALAFGTGIVGLTALEFGWDRVERVARRLFMGIVLIAVLGLATLLVVTLWTGAWPK